jgi:hypothetical protein
MERPARAIRDLLYGPSLVRLAQPTSQGIGGQAVLGCRSLFTPLAPTREDATMLGRASQRASGTNQIHVHFPAASLLVIVLEPVCGDGSPFPES